MGSWWCSRTEWACRYLNLGSPGWAALCTCRYVGGGGALLRHLGHTEQPGPWRQKWQGRDRHLAGGLRATLPSGGPATRGVHASPVSHALFRARLVGPTPLHPHSPHAANRSVCPCLCQAPRASGCCVWCVCVCTCVCARACPCTCVFPPVHSQGIYCVPPACRAPLPASFLQRSLSATGTSLGALLCFSMSPNCYLFVSLGVSGSV